MTHKNRITDAVVTERLANGLTIHVWPRPGSGNVTVNAAVGTGSMHEGEFLGHGLSHFLEHVVFSGTKKFPGGTQIADNVAAAGGYLNASTSYARTQFYIGMSAKNFEYAVDMLYGMTAEPLFPEDRFIKEKNVILRECAMCNDRPERKLWYALWENMFLSNPIRYPVIGFEDKVSAVTRDMMTEYYRRRYSPSRTHFVVAGDIDPDMAINAFSKICSGWERGRIDEPVLPSEPPQTETRIAETFFAEPMARMAIGWKIPSAASCDFPAIDVLATLLGGLDSSPLCANLRNELALVNDIDAFAYSADANPGAACIIGAMPPENLDSAVEKTMRIVASFAEKPVTAKMLAKASADAENNFLRAIRGNSGAVMSVTSAVMTNGEPGELDNYLEKIRSLKPEDIRAAAEKYFSSGAASIVKQLPQKIACGRRVLPVVSKNGPEMERVVLPRGVRCVVLRDNSLPLCDISVIFPGGRLFEKRDNLFVSNLVSELLCDGNGAMSEREFNNALDENAITLDSGVLPECIYFKMSFMKKKLNAAVKLFRAMLGNISVKPETFEREKRNSADELACDMMNPRDRASDMFDTAIYGDAHILGIPSEDLLATLKKLTVQDVESFISDVLFDPRRAVFSVSGDVTEREALEAAEKISSAVSWSAEEMLDPVPPPVFEAGVKEVFSTLDKEQSVLYYGFPAYRLGAPENDLVKLFVTAANSMSSRLFKTVREERGLAYYTYLSGASSVCCGTLAYVAGVAPGCEKEVFDLFDAERKRLADGGFTSDELESAKKTFLYNLDEKNQNPAALAFSSAYAEYCGSGYDRVFTIRKRIDSITLEDMNSLAKTLFTPSTLVKVSVTPEKSSKKD